MPPSHPFFAMLTEVYTFSFSVKLLLKFASFTLIQRSRNMVALIFPVSKAHWLTLLSRNLLFAYMASKSGDIQNTHITYMTIWPHEHVRMRQTNRPPQQYTQFYRTTGSIILYILLWNSIFGPSPRIQFLHVKLVCVEFLS